jgi:DHA2 family multidrug resistance protein
MGFRKSDRDARDNSVGALSLTLTSFLVHDPPYFIRKSVRTGLKIDYLGFGFLALGLGSLQLLLDKGQTEDWFASTWMRWMALLAVAGLVAMVVWELRQKDPLVDLHLLRNGNFALTAIVMFMLGTVLYGSLVLLPIFLQTLMGYTAMLSGLVLSPGGLVVLLALPVVGRLVSRYDPRWLIIFGLTVTSFSLFYMTGFNLNIDFRTAVVSRLIQGLGLAFLFVPINTLAFSFVSRERTGHATGIVNLARNIGGSVGIAFVTTVVARRAQFHQSVLAAHLTPFDVPFQQTFYRFSQFLMWHGFSVPAAQDRAP